MSYILIISISLPDVIFSLNTNNNVKNGCHIIYVLQITNIIMELWKDKLKSDAIVRDSWTNEMCLADHVVKLNRIRRIIQCGLLITIIDIRFTHEICRIVTINEWFHMKICKCLLFFWSLTKAWWCINFICYWFNFSLFSINRYEENSHFIFWLYEEFFNRRFSNFSMTIRHPPWRSKPNFRVAEFPWTWVLLRRVDCAPRSHPVQRALLWR